MTAYYIFGNKVSWLKRGGDQILQWEKKVVRYLDRAIRRITCLYDFYLDDHDKLKMICIVHKLSKKGRK